MRCLEEETWVPKEISRHVGELHVAVAMSGGVDSSIVAALAAKHAGRIQTFSVVHRDPAYDAPRVFC